MKPLSRFTMRWQPLLIAMMVAIVFPLPVAAHLNSTGLGPAYDGALHFLMSPEDLVPALALALFAGLRGAAYGRKALFLLPGAWLVGGLAGLARSSNASSSITAISFLILGGLIAADVRVSQRAISILAVMLGILHGYLNGSGMTGAGGAAVALLGLITVVFILVALVTSFVVRIQVPWARIAVRVAGSWIAASGLLMAGWALRRGA